MEVILLERIGKLGDLGERVDVKETLAAAEARAAKLADLSVTITHQAGEGGKLFGSVSTSDIADAVTRAGVEISRKEVRLPEGPLRMTGEYEIDIQLHSLVTQPIKVIIEAE